VSHESTSTEVEVPGGDVEVDSKETRWGLGNQAAWLELGYGVTESLIVGGVLSVGNTATEQDVEGPGGDLDQSRTEVLVGPKLDYMFSPDATVRPFIGGVLALRSVSTDNPDTSSTGVLIGGRAGLRIFVEDLVSIDPMLGLSFTAASGEVDPGSNDTSSTSLGIGLGLGLSLWLD